MLLHSLKNRWQDLPVMFKLCLLVTLLLLGVACSGNFALARLIDQGNTFVNRYFNAFYLWFVLLTTLVMLGLACSPLGKVKLGAPGDSPEFGTLSWLSMIFSCGMGSGFLFWGGAEPLYHYLHPPLMGSFSLPKQETIALSYTFFHWGISPWAIYGLTAVAMGFFCFNQGKGLRFSSFLPECKGCPYLKQTLDFFSVMAIITGLAATLGMAVLNTQAGLQLLMHWSGSALLQMAIMLVFTGVFLLSALRGMDAGIKVVSNITMLLSLGLLLMIIWLGPYQTMPPKLLLGVAGYWEHFIPMSLGWGRFYDNQWVNQWTVKYWSWWIAWAPFVGLFLAMISRGRSIRAIVLATLFAPALFSIIWFTAFGNSAIALYNQHAGAFISTQFEHVDQILYQLFQGYTQNPFPCWLSLVLVGLCVCNSADSAVYTVAHLTHDDNTGKPSKAGILCWGGLISALSLILLFSGGITTLNRITAIAVLPFSFILIAVYGVFLKALWQETRKKQPSESEKHPDPSASPV